MPLYRPSNAETDIATGITFMVILLGLLYVLSNYAGGIEAGTPEGLRNLTIFFTVFVMLQFWNMFNAKLSEQMIPPLKIYSKAKVSSPWEWQLSWDRYS